MTGLVFVDTSVLIYTRDKREPAKAKQAIDWIRELRTNDAIVISPQVLNEAYAVARWKFKSTPRQDVRNWLGTFLRHCTAPLDASVFTTALELEAEFGLSWWDCLIVASALAASCTHILSEDMQHAQFIRTARVVNPFHSAPADLLGPR